MNIILITLILILVFSCLIFLQDSIQEKINRIIKYIYPHLFKACIILLFGFIFVIVINIVILTNTVNLQNQIIELHKENMQLQNNLDYSKLILEYYQNNNLSEKSQ